MALRATVGVAPWTDFAGLEHASSKRGSRSGRASPRRTSPESWGSALEREPLEAQWQTNSTRDLAAAGGAGRSPGLDNRQLVLVAAEVGGVRAQGYPTGLCALARIAEVIEATTGMSFHPFTPVVSGGSRTRWVGAANLPPAAIPGCRPRGPASDRRLVPRGSTPSYGYSWSLSVKVLVAGELLHCPTPYGPLRHAHSAASSRSNADEGIGRKVTYNLDEGTSPTPSGRGWAKQSQTVARPLVLRPLWR